MNRPLLITAGIIIVLIVLALWVYLLLFGAPQEGGEVFSNLGFDIASQDVTIAPPADIPLPVTTVDTTGEALRQLTTRPVAGFMFTGTGTSSAVRYIERGTGHMYEIDLTTGFEAALSRTTIPQTAHAIFSSEGTSVALTAHRGYNTSVFVGTLGADSNLEGIQLQPGATNIAFTPSGDALYTVTEGGVTYGYQHDLQSLTRTERFSFNFTNIDMGWGENLTKTYLATKPAASLEGYIYEIVGDTLNPVGDTQFGLSALYSNSKLLLTFTENTAYTSSALNTDGVSTPLPILALKEKCVFDTFSSDFVWCAAPLATGLAVEEWYKGTITSVDNLWLLNTQSGEATLYADFTDLSGRTIDVSSIATNDTGTNISFTNKLDHTLWLYDLTAE